MKKGVELVKILIENANKVQNYDFSYLSLTNSCADKVLSARKLTGSKMTKKRKHSDHKETNYTFNM